MQVATLYCKYDVKADKFIIAKKKSTSYSCPVRLYRSVFGSVLHLVLFVLVHLLIPEIFRQEICENFGTYNSLRLLLRHRRLSRQFVSELAFT